MRTDGEDVICTYINIINICVWCTSVCWCGRWRGVKVVRASEGGGGGGGGGGKKDGIGRVPGKSTRG